jgi:MFS family permease
VSCIFAPEQIYLTDVLSLSIGYAPYAAALYCNNRFGTEWFVYLGASLCGISAGVFWMAEAAIAIAYPEPWNKGKSLGYWLSYRLFGQILGGAINLGLNAERKEAGKVTYTVYLIFIALQCAGPFVGFLLNPPSKVQRKDGKKVELTILNNPWLEIRAMTKLFFTKRFLLILLWIGQAVFAEAVFFTYLACKCSGVFKLRCL